MRSPKLITLLLAGLIWSVSAPAQEKLNRHSVRLDGQNKLISWVDSQGDAYDRVVRLAWDFLINRAPIENNGLKAYYSSCCLDEQSAQIRQWPHNPAGL